MSKNLQENDVILCTVKRIEGTTVFLEIQINSHIIYGTMIFSEVSPGRIRNIREYVVPNKKIVCKVLRIKNNHPELSLRRVIAREREYVLNRHKKEKVLTNIFKPILKDKTQDILQKIKEKYELTDFLDDARENPNILEKYIPKDSLDQIKKIISEKREKEKLVKTTIKLTSTSESGLSDIKKILNTENTIEIYYLGSSKFSLAVKAKTYKEANASLESIIEKIKEKAKRLNATLEYKEK